MDTRVTTIVAVVASGLLMAPVSAAFARDKHHSSGHHAVTRAAPQGQIACTQLGCERIPGVLPASPRANLARNPDRL